MYNSCRKGGSIKPPEPPLRTGLHIIIAHSFVHADFIQTVADPEIVKESIGGLGESDATPYRGVQHPPKETMVKILKEKFYLDITCTA